MLGGVLSYLFDYFGMLLFLFVVCSVFIGVSGLLSVFRLFGVIFGNDVVVMIVYVVIIEV